MLNYDPGTNTLTFNTGEEVVAVFREFNVGTVTSPTVQLYKGSSDVTATYCSSTSATCTNDGSTMLFTTPKFLNTLPPGVYKLHLRGTVDGLVKDLWTFNLTVLKRGV